MRRTLRMVGLLLAAGALAACGGGGGDDGDSSGGDCPPPAFSDLTGIWSVENELSGDCQNELERFDVYMEQNGSELRVLGRVSFTATICGSRATVSRPISYVRNEGVMTVNNLVLTFPDETSCNGTGQWTWTAGSAECRGTLQLRAIR